MDVLALVGHVFVVFTLGSDRACIACFKNWNLQVFNIIDKGLLFLVKGICFPVELIDSLFVGFYSISGGVGSSHL